MRANPVERRRTTTLILAPNGALEVSPDGKPTLRQRTIGKYAAACASAGSRRAGCRWIGRASSYLFDGERDGVVSPGSTVAVTRGSAAIAARQRRLRPPVGRGMTGQPTAEWLLGHQ